MLLQKYLAIGEVRLLQTFLVSRNVLIGYVGIDWRQIWEEFLDLHTPIIFSTSLVFSRELFRWAGNPTHSSREPQLFLTESLHMDI